MSTIRCLSHHPLKHHVVQRTCPSICKCQCHRKYSIRKALALSLSGSFLNVNTAPFTFSTTSTSLNLHDLIQTEHDKDMHCDDDLLSTPSTKIKSFLGSFASTMKRSMKHAVTQQSLSLQNRSLRAELQSRDTTKFLSSAHQALFEEILAEKIWSLYHFEPSKYGQGVPLRVLFNEIHSECLECGLCDFKGTDGSRTFDHRVLTLTKLHASYHDNIWLRMHQLPFHRDSNNNSNNNTIQNGVNLRPFAFKSSATKSSRSPHHHRGQNLSSLTTEDVVGCNIDRTGRIAWYHLPDDESNLLFFPGIFEPDTIFISNALEAVQELNQLRVDSKHNHNTHLLLQSSALLENTKMGFFEQELWRFLSYYPSGGGHQTLLDCHSLFGVDSKETMRSFLRKYVYREQSGHRGGSPDQTLFAVFPDGNGCAIQYDKEHDFFTVNRRLPLMEQITAFQQHHEQRLQSLKHKYSNSSNHNNTTHNTAGQQQEFALLFQSCLSSNCRLFYDVRLLKSVFWSWCHSLIPSSSSLPTLHHFEQMAAHLITKYKQSLRESAGGGNRYLLELSKYEYRLLRQLWFMGTRRGMFQNVDSKPSASLLVTLTKMALDHSDIDWFISILNARIVQRIEVDTSFVYGTLFNVVQDVISEASNGTKSMEIKDHKAQKAESQLVPLMRCLNAAYSVLPKKVHVVTERGDERITRFTDPIHESTRYPVLTSSTKQVNHQHINQRFIQMFMAMEAIPNYYEALREIPVCNLDDHFTRNMAHKLGMNQCEVERKETLADLMEIYRTLIASNASDPLGSGITNQLNQVHRIGDNLKVVQFHHDLKQRRFDDALLKLQALRSHLHSETSVKMLSSNALEAAVRMLTLPTDSKIWRTNRESKNQKMNLHPLKLEIPSILHLVIESVPRLPVNQDVMAQCLHPLSDIMDHITKEHGSMKVVHSVFGRILKTPELPVSITMVMKYLDLYGEYDQLLSSPVPILECILRRYIPPSILSYSQYTDCLRYDDDQRQSVNDDIDHQRDFERDTAFHREDGLHIKGLREFSDMVKTDGIDDKLDPFNASFSADSGYRILPRDLYHKMLKLLNLYSSVHNLGHFNLKLDRVPSVQISGDDTYRTINSLDDQNRKRQQTQNQKVDIKFKPKTKSKAVVECSEMIWKLMEWDGHRPDITVYNTMLDTLCKWDEMTAALALFESMVGDSTLHSNRNGVVEPNNQTLYILADAMVHPQSISHFVDHIAPTEWNATLRNKMKHLQHQSWLNIYKHRGQIVHSLSTTDRVSWVNVQRKYGDLVYHCSNEVFFGYFPRTQFVMAMALNRLEGVVAVLNENAGEWLENLIQCYTIQFLPDYKHIFKVRPQTLRMEIIGKICDSKNRLDLETSATEKMVYRLWKYVEEFRNAYSVKTSNRKFQRDCSWSIADLKQLLSVPALSAFIAPPINGHSHSLKAAQSTILTPSFAKSLFSSKSKSDDNTNDDTVTEITSTVDNVDTVFDSQSIRHLLDLSASIDSKTATTIQPLTVTADHHKTRVVSSAEQTKDLYAANLEWWQSQFEWLRPTLMPQSVSHPELSRDLEHCRCSIFSKSVSTPSQSQSQSHFGSGSNHLFFDENKYIEHLLESSCNLWTLMHVSCAYYRSFDWKNAHLALLRMATELSGRSRPFAEHSRLVFSELMEGKKTRLQFQRTMQHLYWLTGEPYVGHGVARWKRYNSIITSLHWSYLILGMDDTQIATAHNKFLREYITEHPVSIDDLSYLLAARIEGGLFCEDSIGSLSQSLFDRLFAICKVDTVEYLAETIARHLLQSRNIDVIDRIIHSLAKYPDLIAWNDEQHSFGVDLVIRKRKRGRFVISHFLRELLLSLERGLLIHPKHDGIWAMMTRITNNILLIHHHCTVVHGHGTTESVNIDGDGGREQKEGAMTEGQSPLNVKEWSQLFHDNFNRLNIHEALTLLQSLPQSMVHWDLMAKLSFHQFDRHNLNKLSSDELTILLRILVEMGKENKVETVPSSMIHDVESIISEQICAFPEALDTEQIRLLDECLDYFALNKSQLTKAQHHFMHSHDHLAPHWAKFYKYRRHKHDTQVCIDEWWAKDAYNIDDET